MENQKKVPNAIYINLTGLLLAGILGGCSGNTREENQLAKLQWLEGSWQGKMESGLFTETWKPAGNGNLNGASYLIEAGNDTVFSETIALEAKEGGIYYTVTVPGQNKEAPVAFKLQSATENGFVFENPEHDFPQRIIYKKDVKDGLVARIEGKQNGKPASQEFRMKRVE